MDWILIVAGGHGVRMGSEVPKQFIPIDDKPVLMRTINVFRSCGIQLGMVLVLPREQREYWLNLCARYGFESPKLIADGGASRFYSVRNGLALIPKSETGVVGVHDGVRPFVSAKIICKCYAEAHYSGAAIPVTPVVETLRRRSDNITVDRNEFCLVQTPQCFSLELLRRAYRQPYNECFTDDASVAEAAGMKISLIEGSRQNIKITTPFDLAVGEVLAKNRPVRNA